MSNSGGGGGLAIFLIFIILLIAGGLGYWFFGRQYICKNKKATTNVATWKPDNFGCIPNTCVDKMVMNSTKDDCVAAPATLITYTPLKLDKDNKPIPSICRSSDKCSNDDFKNLNTTGTGDATYKDTVTFNDCKKNCNSYENCIAIDYTGVTTDGDTTTGDCYYYINTTPPPDPSPCTTTAPKTNEYCYRKTKS